MDKKKGMKPGNDGLLYELETSMKDKIVPNVPKFLTTRRLTMMTLLWAVLLVVAFYFAKENLMWVNVASLLIVVQYITDVLDGAVGDIEKQVLLNGASTWTIS